MTFKLPTSEEKFEYVHCQFERIAKRYDLTNDVISFGMHRLWKARAVNLLLTSGKNQPKRRFLDVCCGTGDLAIRIAEKLGANDEVVGLDFSGNMLNVARSRWSTTNPKSNCSVTWQEGDAQNLPYPDNHFDGAIISFGLRNLTNINVGLAEMRRVVKPGGLVLNLDLGKPKGVLFASSFKFFFHHVVPVVGNILQNDRKAYTYLPESMTTYPNPDEISQRFEIVGLSDAKHIPLAGGSVALHYGKALR